MILYRVQALDDNGNIPAIGIDQIMEARDIEKFFGFYATKTFKVTTLMDEETAVRVSRGNQYRKEVIAFMARSSHGI